LAESKSIAFLFPGQGSQAVGMGKDFYDRYPKVKEWFDRAETVLDFDLREICFNGPEEKLKQTRFTQPALFVQSSLVTALLAEKEIGPGAVAGHSLGELSALACAGAMSFENGLQLVRERARVMQETAVKHPGMMAAIIGLSSEEVSAVCQESNASGVVVPANFNSPEQTVISGSKEGVAKAIELSKARGAKRTIELAVSGAFHSPLMQDAQDRFQQVLAKTEFQNARIPVYSNVTAGPVTAVSEIPQLLAMQLTHSVRWVETIRNMIRDGIRLFIEVGSGKVLSGLVKRIAPDVEIRTCGTVEELNAILS